MFSLDTVMHHFMDGRPFGSQIPWCKSAIFFLIETVDDNSWKMSFNKTKLWDMCVVFPIHLQTEID